MKRTLIHIHHTLVITCVVFAIFVAVVVTAAHFVAPLISKQRPRIESLASTLLSEPVTIGGLDVVWHGLTPVLRCTDVMIIDKDSQQPLIHVDELDIGLNILKSLLSGSLQLGQVKIIGMHITIHELPTGDWVINGINTSFSPSSTGDISASKKILTWLSVQTEISLENISLEWYDKTGKVLPLTGIDLTLRNENKQHRLWGQARLVQAVPSQLSFVLILKGNLQDTAHLHARCYINAKNILLTQWVQTIPQTDFTIQQGLADFQMWAVWKENQLLALQGQFLLKDTKLTAPDKKATITLQNVGSNMFWQAQPQGGWQFLADHVNVTMNNHAWPENRITVTQIVSANNGPLYQRLQLDSLPLEGMSDLLTASKALPQNLQDALHTLQPQGELQHLALLYQPAVANTASNFVIDTDLHDVGFMRWNAAPGVQHLTGHLYATTTKGELDVASQDIQLDFGPMFRKPLLFNQLSSHAEWQKTKLGWLVRATQFAMSNEDAQANATLTFYLPADGSQPMLRVLAGYHVNSAKHIDNYLPLTILKPELVQWLDGAITRVKDADGTLVINGGIHDFPYDNYAGTFIIDSQINDADLNYWEKWPPLQHFSGNLIFAERSMAVIATAGQILSTPLQNLHAEIPILKKEIPAVLQVTGSATGSLAEGFDFLRNSPLRHLLSGSLANLQASGPLQLQLGLQVPLEHKITLPNGKTMDSGIQVKGQVVTQNAALTLPDWNLQFDGLSGQLDFTQDTLTSKPIMATLWKKPVTIIFQTGKGGGTQVMLSGQIGVSDLQQHFKQPFFKYLSGATRYQATLALGRANAGDRLDIGSDLKGVAVALPAPLAKAANEAVAFNLGIALPAQQITINYRNLQANMSQRNDGLWINLTMPNAQGQIIVPTAKQAPIQVNLRTLYLDSTLMQGEQRLQPGDIPAINFSCNDFRYGEKHFGNVQIQLIPISGGITINSFRATAPAFNLTATGNWRGTRGGQRSDIKGVLSSNNIAQALQSLGLPAGFTAKSGKVQFALSWAGAPYNPDFAQINGTLSLLFTNGEIANAGSGLTMGLGQLLTLTSWQSLARRVHLDFSDLTTQNFSFDTLKGDFTLSNGNAVTKNMSLDGPVAHVNVSGRIGLAAEDYNLQVGVTPHLSSNLSLLAGFAAGPVVGVVTSAAALIAGKVFSSQINSLSVDNYNITGSWAKPSVQRVGGK